MRVAGKLTEADLKEVRKMVRSKWYWLKFALVNWYGLALICIVLWATLAALNGGINKPNWQAIGLMWAIIAAIVWWSMYRVRSAMSRELAKLNATLPDAITVASDGFKFEGPDGASAFQPWRSFKSMREGQRVVLVDRPGGAGFVILPVAEMPESERQSLRSMLQSSVSESTAIDGSMSIGNA